MLTIPQGFAQTTRELYGEPGSKWLRRLPGIVSGLEAQWSIRVCGPFEPLSYNWVAPVARDDGSTAVLKLGFPDPERNRELHTEIEALRLYDGRGIARLLKADPDLGAMLLERLEPGTSLHSIEDDEEATRVAAGVMRALWRPVSHPHPFPTPADWGRGFERLRREFSGGTGPFPDGMVRRAEEWYLHAGEHGQPVLLHGDLHHGNILAAEREPWLAIDPKGLVGEPEYEVPALLRNAMTRVRRSPSPTRMMRRRIAVLADELGLDAKRIREWLVAQQVLSAWWTYEDHGHGWEEPLADAHRFAEL